MVDVQLLEHAKQQHQAGQLENAERAYREILDEEPDQPEALHLLGVIAHQHGRNEEAVGLLTQATAAKPGFSQALNHLGSALNALGRYQEAWAAYHQALATDPDFSDAHFNLGVSLQAAGELEAAIASYEQALNIEPDLLDAHVNLGRALRDFDRGDDALAAFRRAVELDPESSLAQLNLGIHLREIERPDDAIAVFQTVTELTPDRAEAHTYLGQTLWRSGRKNEAIEPLSRAAELQPDSAPVQYNLSQALFAMGDPRAPDARLNLGVALLRGDDAEAALETFDANLQSRGNPYTRELAMKSIALKQLGRHEAMEEVLAYDSFLSAVSIDPPPEFESLEAFNQSLLTHIHAHPGELAGSGGPIEALEQIVSRTLAAFTDSLPPESDHRFAFDPPQSTKLSLTAKLLNSPAERVPQFFPNAWVSGVYFVKLAETHISDEGPEIEFGLPDPWFQEWMRIRGLTASPGSLMLFPGYWYHRLSASGPGSELAAISIESIPEPGSHGPARNM